MDSQDDLEHFSLKWNNYNDTMKTGFHDLLKREDFVDVTIAVQGKLIQAHKMVLSICSPYFKTIFKSNPCQHPVVFLRDVTHREISGILQFMYLGEVSIAQEDLAGFLRTAEALQVKGLSSEDADETIPPKRNDAGEFETKVKEEKIEILSSYDDNNDRNSTKLSPLCNGDNIDKIKTKRLPSNDSQNGDDDEFDEDNDNDEDDEDNEEEDDDEDNDDDDDVDDGEDDDDDDDMDVHGGGEPKKMKMSSADDRLAPIDPHVPVIKTPERPVINSNTQSSQVVRKNVRLQTDNNALTCVRASVLREVDRNGDQSSDDREDYVEEIMSSLNTGNVSEVAQVHNLQRMADLHTQGGSQQGTSLPTMLRKNQALCPICGRILQHKKNLQTHIMDQHTGIFGCWPCQICHRVCRTWSALRVHTNRHHLNLPPAAVQMSIIGIAQDST